MNLILGIVETNSSNFDVTDQQLTLLMNHNLHYKRSIEPEVGEELNCFKDPFNLVVSDIEVNSILCVDPHK